MKIKKSLSTLKDYVPGKPQSKKNIIKLNANECPYDLPESIYKKAGAIRGINRYHEPSGLALREKIAHRLGLKANNIVLGNGSGELIKTFLESFSENGSEIIMPETTFSLYSLYGTINGNNITQLPLTKDLKIDLNATIKAINHKTAALFICNPNNPTGHTFSYTELEEFFKQVPNSVGIFLDEAYIEYSEILSDEYAKKMIEKYSNLTILRTFSKIGLAGLRIGYAMGTEETISNLHRVRPPFNTNLYAQNLALAILDEKEFLGQILENNQKERSALSDAIQKLGYRVYESQGNFILIKAFEGLADILEKQNIYIRSAKSFGLSSDYFRITIGTPEENRALLKALEEERQ